MSNAALIKIMLCGAYALPLVTSFTLPTVADSHVGMDMDAAVKVVCKKAPKKTATRTVTGVLTYPEEAGGGTDVLGICISQGVGAHVNSTPDGPDGIPEPD